MGKKSAPNPPPAPDPRQIAQTDVEFNRIDQQTPFGSLTYGGPNRNQANLTLSPELQNLFNLQTDSATQAQGGINSLIQNPLNAEGLPALPQNFDAYRGDAERAFYDRSAGLLNEQFGRDEENLRQTLANQGLQSGGTAFGQEFGDFNRRRGETYSNLARDAVLFGGQEASRSLAGQSGLRSQLLGERGSLRSGQFGELASILGLQQVPQPSLQNFFAPGQAGVTDAYGLNEASLQNAFNAISGRNSSAKGAGADLAGTLGSAFIGKGK